MREGGISLQVLHLMSDYIMRLKLNIQQKGKSIVGTNKRKRETTSSTSSTSGQSSSSSNEEDLQFERLSSLFNILDTVNNVSNEYSNEKRQLLHNCRTVEQSFVQRLSIYSNKKDSKIDLRKLTKEEKKQIKEEQLIKSKLLKKEKEKERLAKKELKNQLKLEKIKLRAEKKLKKQEELAQKQKKKSEKKLLKNLSSKKKKALEKKLKKEKKKKLKLASKNKPFSKQDNIDLYTSGSSTNTGLYTKMKSPNENVSDDRWFYDSPIPTLCSFVVDIGPATKDEDDNNNNNTNNNTTNNTTTNTTNNNNEDQDKDGDIKMKEDTDNTSSSSSSSSSGPPPTSTSVTSTSIPSSSTSLSSQSKSSLLLHEKKRNYFLGRVRSGVQLSSIQNIDPSSLKKVGLTLHTCDAESLVQVDVPPFMLGDLMNVIVTCKRFQHLLQMPHISMSQLSTSILAKPKKGREGATPLILVNLHSALLRILAEDAAMKREQKKYMFDPTAEFAKPWDDEPELDTSGDWAYRQAQHRFNYILPSSTSTLITPKPSNTSTQNNSGLSAYKKKKKIMLAEVDRGSGQKGQGKQNVAVQSTSSSSSSSNIHQPKGISSIITKTAPSSASSSSNGTYNTTVHYTTTKTDSNGIPQKKTKVVKLVHFPKIQYPLPIEMNVDLILIQPDSPYTFDDTWDNTDRTFRNSILKFRQGNGNDKKKAPKLGGRPLNMYALYTLVYKMGGYDKCCIRSGAWSTVHYHLPNYSPTSTSASSFLKGKYILQQENISNNLACHVCYLDQLFVNQFFINFKFFFPLIFYL